MDENKARILDESNKVINRLQVISAFFDEEITYKIFLRTQVIHKLFESDADLDINKLELFHVQFTDSVIELLKKVKKSNEKNISLLYEEVRLNKDVIDKLSGSVYTEASFNLDKQRQALKINQTLKKLYDLLSNYSTEYPFAKNISHFSSVYGQDFYYDISPELLGELTRYEAADVYSNEYATIQKKLMGQLCKNEFRTEFVRGLKAGAFVIEVYRFIGEERYFLYFPSGNLFLFLDPARIAGIDWTTAYSKKGKIIQELHDKNNQLESSEGALKSFIPIPLKNLLVDYYKKISDINFLQRGDFEIQANILKTMLNTDSI